MRPLRRPPAAALLVAALATTTGPGQAQTLDDAGLQISPYITGLQGPTGVRFLGAGEALVIQKNDGRVRHFNAGALSDALDLNVQFDNERGLLGIALSPDFATSGHVYLTHSATAAAGDSDVNPNWTANLLTRHTWNGSQLTNPVPVHTIASFDPAQANGPNHNGGPILFGPDGKLYGTSGDLNRDRAEQNEPTQAGVTAGTGGLYRLNPDGSIPADNPFTGDFARWFATGVRNSFGITVDPVTGALWDTENGPDSYDEINRVARGFNSGWNPIMGPDGRDPQNAPGDLVLLPGASYSDPEFSVRDSSGITSLLFLTGSDWGPAYDDAVLFGGVTGDVFLLRLNAARDGFVLPGALADGVADPGEEDLAIFGSGFGVITDLQIGPDGAVYLSSLNQGAVYRLAPVPLPAAAWLLGAGLALLAPAVRRRRDPGFESPDHESSGLNPQV